MQMKKSVIFLFGIFLLVLMGLPVESTAISIPPPPIFQVYSPPPMVVIPGTYIYIIPDIDVDILFYQGYWYRPHGGYWYRSRSYNGPWAYLRLSRVPSALLDLPPDYYRVSPEYERIPYGLFWNNWGRWERERYWHRHEGWLAGRRPPPPHVVHSAPPPPHVVHPAPPPPHVVHPAPHYHPAPPPPGVVPPPKPHYHPAPPPKP